MMVAIGADHAGYVLKQEIIPTLRSLGHEVEDLGTHSTEPVDYPDVAEWVARAVLTGRGAPPHAKGARRGQRFNRSRSQ